MVPSLQRSAFFSFVEPSACDADAIIGVAFWQLRFVGAICDGGSFVVHLHPGGEVRAIEGHRFAQARNRVLESGHGGVQEGLEQAAVYVAEPVLTRQGVLHIEAVGLAGIKGEAKAHSDDQEGMAQQQAAYLSGGEHAFTDADQKGFKEGRF